MTAVAEPFPGPDFVLRPLPPLPSRTWWRRFTAPSHVSPEAIRTLANMGYDRAAARRALSRTGNDLPAAIQMLEEADRDAKLSMAGSSAESSTCRSETRTPIPEEHEDELRSSHDPQPNCHPSSQPQSYPLQNQYAPASPPRPRPRRFFTLGPLNLPSRPNRSSSRATSIGWPSRSTPALESECERTVAESISSASESPCTPTTPTAFAPTGPHSSPAAGERRLVSSPPPACSAGSSNPTSRPTSSGIRATPSTRRRWPLQLSRQDRGPQLGVPDWARVWDRKERERDRERSTGAGAGAGTDSDYEAPRQASSTVRHSIHGGAILPVSSLPSRSQSYTDAPGHAHTRSLGSERPPQRPYLSFAHARALWDGRAITANHTAGEVVAFSHGYSSTYSYAGPTPNQPAPHHHPFAASLVHCSTETALWETDCDAGSDVGTFGVKQPDEWHWNGCANATVDCVVDDPEHDDDYDDDGVDVEAWRANMNHSTFW